MSSLAPLPKPWRETPLIESTTLSRAAACSRIFMKLENLQPSSSFKSRGIGNIMLFHVDKARQSTDSESKPLHFYISSGGNAGLACATAATTLGYKSTVVLPTSTEESTILKLRAAGAGEVISHGDSWAFADDYLRTTVIPRAEAAGEKGIYVPPFDHPLVWEGASTLVDEIARQMPEDEEGNPSKPDAIICSVGGGGLFCGIMQGLAKQQEQPKGTNWLDGSVQVLAVETHGADSLDQSVQARKLITLPAITSMATSLGAVRVTEQALNYVLTQPNIASTIVLEDAEAAMGSWRLADDERILVEPACGVSCALAYDGRLQQHVRNFGPESKVVIVVCGGARVSLKDLMTWKDKYGSRAEELGKLSRERYHREVNGGGDGAAANREENIQIKEVPSGVL